MKRFSTRLALSVPVSLIIVLALLSGARALVPARPRTDRGDHRMPFPTRWAAASGYDWRRAIDWSAWPSQSTRLALAAQQPATAPGLPDNWHVGISTELKYISSTPPDAGGENYNGPERPAAVWAELKLDLGVTFSSDASLFTLLKLEYKSPQSPALTIERLYFNVRNAFGLRALDLRLGRDAITLGPIGLLLDERFYEEDRRDGIQVWLPDVGPLRVYLFAQWALEDRATSRWLTGGRAELPIVPGWTLGANFRSDTAALGDTGTCPGIDCNTGTGIGFDLEGQIIRGATLTLAYAAYTQTSDAARSYWQANLVLELERLLGLRRFEPVVTLWYKNFDPYTIPGGPGGTAPRGAFGTPDDFNLFNVNDNLAAFGIRLDLALRKNLGFFILTEWGAYKNGGPDYTIFSIGLAHSLTPNVEIKLTYNTYTVTGGTVVTNPVSLIELGNVSLFQFAIEGNW